MIRNRLSCLTKVGRKDKKRKKDMYVEKINDRVMSEWAKEAPLMATQREG